MCVDDQCAFVFDGCVDGHRALIHVRASIKTNEAFAEFATVGVVHRNFIGAIPDRLTIVYLGRVRYVDSAIEAKAGEGGVPVWQVARSDFLCGDDIGEGGKYLCLSSVVEAARCVLAVLQIRGDDGDLNSWFRCGIRCR